MKLVEILARDFEEWPKDVRVKSITQDNDLAINLYSTDRPAATQCGGCWKAEGFIEYLTRSNTLASDHKTAIVTREMWQAEREKLKPKKANSDGWIRNRGRSDKCPVPVGTLVDYVMRGGLEMCGVTAEARVWKHHQESSDIMRYRIHKPTEQPGRAAIVEQMQDQCACLVESASSLKQEGPLQWRDRIREIDRTVEALEEERVSLIQRLEDEGLQLLQGKVCGSVQPVEDMSDWRNWRLGDIAEVVSTSGFTQGKLSVGDIVPIIDIDEQDGKVKAASSCWGDVGGNYKWHSRPSA